jgi:hypothetical protein
LRAPFLGGAHEVTVANESDPFGDAPEEVYSFFQEAVRLRDPELQIYPLTADESRVYSSAIQQSDVGAALGLIALDDANDSNPYCLISRGVARGMVVHFSHDPEPEIRFPDLASFRASLNVARDQHLSIDQVPFEPLRPHTDQQRLIDALAGLNRESSDTAEFLLCLYIPLIAPEQIPILEQLATSSSFFVRESVARYIEIHPRSEHGIIAAKLAKDNHPQVSQVGKQALSSVNRVAHSKA